VVAKKRKAFIGISMLLIMAFLFSPARLGFCQPVQGKMPNQAQMNLSVNQATLEQLQGLKGVGPVIAQRIVDHRSQNGSFKSLDELTEVKGIGKAKFEKIKDQLTL